MRHSARERMLMARPFDVGFTGGLDDWSDAVKDRAHVWENHRRYA